MALTINHNIMASNASRSLSTHYGGLSTSVRRLSSGLRVGTAADDAAGLAIRELMRAEIASLNQGVRNANDAISMLQTADGALQIIDEKLIRMKELAEQAATGTYNSDQRLMIDSEFQAMKAEIDRIANATDFNGVKMLCNDATGKLLRAPGISGTATPLNLNGYNMVGWPVYEPVVTVHNPDAITHDVSLEFFHHGVVYDMSHPPSGPKRIIKGLGGSSVGLWGEITVRYDGSGFNVQSHTDATVKSVTQIDADTLEVELTGGTAGNVLFVQLAITDFLDTPGSHIHVAASVLTTVIKDTGGYDNMQYVDYRPGATKSTDIDLDGDGVVDITISNIDTYGAAATLELTRGKEAVYATKIHFGTGNDSSEDYYYIESRDSTARGLGIDNLAVQTQGSAQQCLTRMNDAIARKDGYRAYFGAMQNRLENTISNLQIQAENLQAAESRISDVDVATEMTEFVRSQILTQAATAMLSQANSMPQMALSLINR